MKIGELSLLTETKVETIRFYEREGLLPRAMRSDGNYRIYDEAHVRALSFVRHCRHLDMTLDEIRVLLRFKETPKENCAQVNALLDEHMGHVAARIRELRELEKQLKALRAQCLEAQDAQHCGILTALSLRARRQPVAATSSSGHVQGSHGGQRSSPATKG